jgi:hypothetical protein
MPLILGANSVSGGYEVDNSLRFNSGSSDYLTRTPASSGNRQIMTFSFWLKRSNLGDGTNYQTVFQINGYTYCKFHETTNTFTFGDTAFDLETTQVFRDVSAWYHFVLAVDTTQATNTNRVKIYVNGTQVTALTATYPTQNTNLNWNTGSVAHQIGRHTSAGQYLNGYLSEFNFIDGQQLTPSSFGETDEDTNIWKPIPYTGSFGTNGFYLEFQNSGSLGTDSSGNGNNFTVNNLTSIDQTTDTPTNNFATLNSLIPHSIPILYKEGNTVAFDTTANFNSAFSSIGISSGKWYFEAKTSTNNGFVGICKSDGIFPASSPAYLGQSTLGTNSWGYYADSGTYFHNGSATAYGDSWTNTDIIGCALDLDNNKLYFSKNGVFQNSGVPTSGATGTGAISITSGTYLFGVTKDNESSEMLCNFGNPSFTISSGNADANGYGNFEYAVPSGYYALCTKNLAEYA